MNERAVEVREPREDEYVSVNPDPRHRQEYDLVSQDGVYYAVTDDMLPKLEGKAVRAMLFTAMNDDHKIFLWPVAMPVASDHPVYLAMRGWVKLTRHTRQ